MKFTLRKKILALLGSEYSILDEKGNLVAYAKQKAFKLKEEINIFEDTTMTDPLIKINARNIIDFHATYDVIDGETNEKLGSFQRQGVKSMFRDEWHVLDVDDKQIGIVQEESGTLAFLRRFITNLIPQRFDLRIGEEDAGGFEQAFNLFRYVLEIDVNEKLLDRRMAFAMAVLLGVIEGRQSN